jgi:hypothetical protein
MKDSMTRKEGCVFKVRVVGERKKEGTGGLALKMMTIVQEAHRNKVERKDLEGMVRKEIIRVYEKAEGKESSEKEEEESNEGEEGRADSLEPPRSRTRSEKKKEEETKKRVLDEPRKALVAAFNENVGPNERKAASTNNVPERAKPSGERMKGKFMSWCCPHAFSHEVNCMFAWCTVCYEKMETERDEGGADKRVRRRRTRVNDSSTAVVSNLRGDCVMGHTMEDMKHLVSNDDQKYLKRNRTKVLPLVVDTCWGCGHEF